MLLKTKLKPLLLLLLMTLTLGQNLPPFANRQNIFNPVLNNQLAGQFVPILEYSNERNNDGSYRYSFSTADGKQVEESGFLKDVTVGPDGEPQGIQVVQGSYSYTSPDGTPVEVTYIADENGFQPTGVHIPANGAFARNPSRLDPKNPLTDRYNPYNPGYNNPGYNNPGYNNAAYTNPRYNSYNRFNNPYRNNAYYNNPYNARTPYNAPYPRPAAAAVSRENNN